jgi:hypothetical protein
MTAESIRKDSTVTISLKDSEAVFFLHSLNLKKEITLDESIKVKEHPLIIVVDCYKGTPSKDKYDTLLCTDKFAYFESNPERYLSPDSLLRRITTLVNGGKAEQDAAANP